MCDRSFTQRSQWKWKCIKTRSLVSNFILITPGLLVWIVFYYKLYIWRIESCNHVGNWNWRLWYYTLLKAVQSLIHLSLRSFSSFSAILNNPKHCSQSPLAHKYAIMVLLLSSLLGWLEWRLRLSWPSNVGLMVLTCTGHRWSPEQPWLGPFINPLWRQKRSS